MVVAAVVFTMLMVVMVVLVVAAAVVRVEQEMGGQEILHQPLPPKETMAAQP
jgi:hypothetical protein